MVGSPWLVGGSAQFKDRGTKATLLIQFPTVRHADLMMGGGERLDTSFTLEVKRPFRTVA